MQIEVCLWKMQYIVGVQNFALKKVRIWNRIKICWNINGDLRTNYLYLPPTLRFSAIKFFLPTTIFLNFWRTQICKHSIYPSYSALPLHAQRRIFNRHAFNSSTLYSLHTHRVGKECCYFVLLFAKINIDNDDNDGNDDAA